MRVTTGIENAGKVLVVAKSRECINISEIEVMNTYDRMDLYEKGWNKGFQGLVVGYLSWVSLKILFYTLFSFKDSKETINNLRAYRKGLRDGHQIHFTESNSPWEQCRRFFEIIKEDDD